MLPIRRLLAAASVLVLVSACDASGLDAGAPADQASVSAPVDPITSGGDTLQRAMTLLRDNYVDRVELPRLLAASQRGAWMALAEVGVPPTDVELPNQRASIADTLPAFRARYGRIAMKYGSKVDPSFLAHEMVRKAADSLDDCHTGFLSPEQAREQAQRLSGATRFGGIGVILRRPSQGDGFIVVEVFENAPAAKAGVKRGDILVSVDDGSLNGLAIEQVVAIVRGQEGTPVKLGVSRAGMPDPIQMHVTRAQVAAPILRSAIFGTDIGYVRLYGFPEPLTAQLDNVLKEFEQRGVVAVVVDLRDNSGGQLDVITKVTSRFVRDGPIFRQIGQNGERTVYQADGSDWLQNRPLVVLVNGGTGSGGEIFASAVKEHRAGLLVGTKTAGCVSTGQMFPLPDGSALEIATNRVVSGLRSAELNRVGVGADDTVETRAIDLANDRDPQLARALEILAEG